MSVGNKSTTLEAEIGQRIMILRGEETQEELAAAIGVSREIIQHWERGTRHIKAGHLRALAEHFGKSVDYLVGLVGNDNSTNDEKLRMISEYTGLSNEAIQNLHVFLCYPLSPYRYSCKKWCNYMVTSDNFMALAIGLSNYAVAFAKSTVEDWKREKEDKKATEQGKSVIRIDTGDPSFDEAKGAAGWRLSKVLHEMTTDIENTFGIDDTGFFEACGSLIEDETEYAEFIEYMKTK